MNQPDSNDAKPLLQAIRGEQPAVPPIWLMRQAGRYLPEYREVRKAAGSFLDLCFNPELAVEVTLQPIRRYGFDAAILFSDILVVPLALGQSVSFRVGVGPVLDPVRTPEDLRRLHTNEVEERLAPVYETVRRLSLALPARTALIGFAGAPWTVATYMVEGGTSRDHARTKQWAYAEPESFSRLIDMISAATVEHLSAQVRAGAEVLQLFDTWAGALSYSAMRKWCLEPTLRIVRELKARFPDVPAIVFPRGIGEGLADYAAETAFDVISLDSSASPRLGRVLQRQKVVQGNLDPYLLAAGGASMREEVRRLLESFAEGPYVFNLGHGIIPSTPPEHVEELVSLVRQANGREG